MRKKLRWGRVGLLWFTHGPGLSFCLFLLLSFCLFVFLSRYHCVKMSEGSELLYFPLCQLTNWVTKALLNGMIYILAQILATLILRNFCSFSKLQTFRLTALQMLKDHALWLNPDLNTSRDLFLKFMADLCSRL